MKTLITIVIIIVVIGLGSVSYLSYENYIGYRYTDGDYKNIRLGDSEKIVLKKLNYLMSIDEIRPSMNYYATKYCKLPNNFTVTYFDKNLDVYFEFYRKKLYKMSFGGWHEYSQSQYLTKLKIDSSYIKSSLTKKYGQPKIGEKYPEEPELSRIMKETFPFEDWTLAEWDLPKKSIVLELSLVVYETGKGSGGYIIEITSNAKKDPKKDIQDMLKKDF